MLMKNKLKRYFLYAIGEVTLVVIGILIALSIDNWNEDRKDLIKEQRILIHLRDEYSPNLIQLEEKISTRNAMVKACHEVLSDIDNPVNVNRDTTLARLILLSNDPTFDPIVNDLIASGNIRLVRNEELKRLLTNWSSDLVAVQEVEKGWTKLVDEYVLPFYAKAGITRDALDLLYLSSNAAPFALDKSFSQLERLGRSRNAPSTTKILSDKELEGIISIAIGFNNSANVQSYALRIRIKKILSLLEQEITSDEHPRTSEH